MSVDPLLTECAERGYRLSYLRQRDHDHGAYTWEAMLLSPILERRSDGYVYSSGYGCGHTAAHALESALDAISRDPHLVEPFQPASNPSVEHVTPCLNLLHILAAKPNPFQGRRL